MSLLNPCDGTNSDESTCKGSDAETSLSSDASPRRARMPTTWRTDFEQV